MDNSEVRPWYHAQLRQIAATDRELEANGASLEERARRAHSSRREARLGARQRMTTGVEVEKLGKRDLAKYGQADGPTFDQLRDKHLAAGAKTAEAFQRIIDSSQRSDEAIDRLFYAP